MKKRVPEAEPNPGVSIRPGVKSIALYRHLNYKAWYAMAEFVDNSIQSYLDNREALRKLHGKAFQLTIHIDVDEAGERVSVRDNAAGISAKDLPRAFRPAEPPPNTSGLSEFGVGMKSAACWFASRWTVKTKALGEPVERTIRFDVDHIVATQEETLYPTQKPAKPEDHHTEIILERLHTPLTSGRTIGKVKEHLASMYRAFLRESEVIIKYRGEALTYEEPKELSAPHYKNDDGPEVLWRKDIEFDFGPDNKFWASGFAAIRAKGSSQGAGFALMRRKRIIVGSGDEGYRPDEIFGRSTTNFRYQRLFGELELHGMEVSHTKDAFNWMGTEEEFLKRLKEQLEAPPKNLLEQADEYRAKATKQEMKPAASQALQATVSALSRVGPDIEAAIERAPDPAPPPRTQEKPEVLEMKAVDIRVAETDWHVDIQYTTKPEKGDWLSVVEEPPQKAHRGARHLTIAISLAHPFMQRYANEDKTHLTPIALVGVALALAERVTILSGAKHPSAVRRTVNDLLSGELSKP